MHKKEQGSMRQHFKYQKIMQLISQDINNMNPGQRLQGRNELAEKYEVSRVTVEKAIQSLIEDGVLFSAKGSGTFVSEQVLSIKPRLDNSNGALEYPSVNEEKSNGRKVFAVLISNIINDIYPFLLRGIEDVANTYGISITVCNTDNKVEKQENYIRRLLNNKIDGIIMVPAIDGQYDMTIFEEVNKRNIPIVCCYRPIPGRFTTGIYCNSFSAGVMATQHLINSGCKKIAYLSLPIYATAFDRYQGYVTALENNRLSYDSELVIYDSAYDTETVGENIADMLISKRPDVDGIFAFNDRIAVGIYMAMKKRNLIPGKDIKIVACDNTSVCNLLSVPLTSINFPIYDIGVEAIKLVLYMLDNPSDKQVQIRVLPPKIVARGSG